MATNHYDWSEGPAELDAHSLTKHEVLVSYLYRYFEKRTLSRVMDVFRITLVDGFCGGGLYQLKGTGQEALGSPLRMLAAVKEAEFKLNIGRAKPLRLVVQYIFIDKDASAIAHLSKVLRDRGYGTEIDHTIHLINSEFAGVASTVISLVRKHTPRSANALFFLDQYGYKEVPAPLIRKILTELDRSEIVLTFHVSSFATYTNEDLVDQVGRTLGIDIRSLLVGKTIDELKSSDADWRRFIQGALYQALVTSCGAAFFTPFFIRGEGSGHGEYWLVHLSQHPRAQDVMKQVHWEHHNHFVHYGGAGLNMLAPQTMGFHQQFNGGFRFDDVAKKQSGDALREQLAQKIFGQSNPIEVGHLFSSTCNTSPATAAMYNDALEELVGGHDVVVTSADGKTRRYARYMKDTDIIQRNPQTNFLQLFSE